MTSTTTLDHIDTSLEERRPRQRRTVLVLGAATLGVGAALLLPSRIGGSSAPDRSPTVVPMSADATEHWRGDLEPVAGYVGSADAAERLSVAAPQSEGAPCVGLSADATERCVALNDSDQASIGG